MQIISRFNIFFTMNQSIVDKYGAFAAEAIEYLIANSDPWDALDFSAQFLKESETPDSPVSPYDPLGELSEEKGILYNERNLTSELSLESLAFIRNRLRDTFGGFAADPMMFLIERMDEMTVKEFMLKFLYKEKLAELATVKVIVRPLWDENLMHGNTGKFLIILQDKDGQETRVKFTNKSSFVYYLVHLIQRKNKPEGEIPPFALEYNQIEFISLYRACYDITLRDAKKYCDKLLYRQEGTFRRAGRKHEIIRDINTYFERAFYELGESAIPYTISARSHLSVPASLIIFEGTAEDLLERYEFNRLDSRIRIPQEKLDN